MKSAKSPQTLRLLRLAAAVSALAMASCATPPPPPLPPIVIPPAAPPPPPVALAPSVIEAAGAYRAYIRRAASITGAFADGAAVQRAVEEGSAYEPIQFLRGEIAYAALVALQNPQFVAAVRTYAVDPASRADLSARLIADPHYASALPSAGAAALLVSATLRADAAKIRNAGELVKQAAYDVQRQNWSKLEVSGRDQRLANAKMLSARPVAAAPEDVRLLAASVNGSDTSALSLADATTLDPASAQFTAVVSRGLAIAALAALGEGGPSNEAGLQRLLDEQTNAFCLNLAKLNLYQCLSVAKPYYEDVFCLGQHILIDTAQCVAKGAGGATAAELAPAYQPIVAKPAPPPKAPARPAARRRTR
ncbi:MAG: hypothetical protein B7Y99_04835 [Caulobacterales bacterium 32-69-10]|nr:MAG: hypothetical protein B7Y99_04835 [Caulobacterales bacterium 32-69-10]